jgi:hypothetical protein
VVVEENYKEIISLGGRNVSSITAKLIWRDEPRIYLRYSSHRCLGIRFNQSWKEVI